MWGGLVWGDLSVGARARAGTARIRALELGVSTDVPGGIAMKRAISARNVLLTLVNGFAATKGAGTQSGFRRYGDR